MKQNRFWEIDFLRGVSIIVVILIHCTVYFYSDPIAKELWNISQVSVPIFIFCSLYIFFAKEYEKKEPFFTYLYKRVKRLLIPYYLFIPFFFGLLLLTKPKILTTEYLLQSFTVTGGIDINWLILLFLQLTIVLSVIKAIKHKTILLFLITVFSAIASLYFVFFNVPSHISHKLIMWLPWSLMLGSTYLFARYQTKKNVLISMGSLSYIVYFLLILVLQTQGDSLIFRDNKYPPNLYYLSYGMFGIIVLYFLAPLFKRFEKPVSFLSTNSYQLYFIHYFFLIWFVNYKPLLQLHWSIFFLFIFGVSLCALWIMNRFSDYFNKA